MKAFIEGISNLTLSHVVMFIIGGILIYLAIKKEYEPMLLLPIGFGIILANIPFSSAIGENGFLTILYNAGIKTELFPILIFIAVGAMIDFSPLLQQPFMIFFGAAAQLGIFLTIIFAYILGFDLKEAASIGIIGAADGPTSIYVANLFAPKLLGPISVAAYSYMALVPIIQPPVIRILTTKEERKIRMDLRMNKVSKTAKILFPIAVTFVAGVLVPSSVPLVGSLMFGNLIRESGVVERLSKAAQNELANLVTLLLGITIGSTMTADKFLTPTTLLIFGMGLIAFIFDTAGGVLFAKFLNLFLKNKVNPMVGAAGISAFPMSSRVVQKMAQEEDPTNFILMQAAGANVAGQIGSIIAGGIVIALVSSIV
ncbi:sodium ion-translocating decarboxylase subunit beta [Caldanaerobacter subterraneus]|jgi:oxaloacetate decarboxylase beta subunit|uniref:Na+-transporting methylmalonyl-CoA/oxaloacetate decarboxylase, beta subunit n=3 Tax=Caldanaerobacter subterraneus TaxID=911092 RepID=Q8RD02_CALS4|nr:sodium ion-translocating decarboxylase subunit beta [Caldanaerobacter subterraneus]AAM23548.1 Na+-transporting methylmalonyl-CoA/oxaloacetate decarboxylase, beta subunit [Caldanaerobacter subterraneus subsp. tengcongensis MB4]KKC30669.1 Na+-transporting methylmalonyl-CoA/oxaloacetate decarboxylase, beta subunit [Caldanaerobacter subterraneus subsp. pacificus DSM 12653]MCS3916969.1 oxaloacetate decarboxylase beta subunit [Caldanaerobacter subterraneus subsp. tengcongensis MB4]TCO61857.1 oxalo